MKRADAIEHMRACASFSQAGATNTVRMVSFVLATIQQSLEAVPDVLDDFEDLGAGSRFAFGSKATGLAWLADHGALLYECAMVAKDHADADQALLQTFLNVPGLGLPKAGFAAQLFAGRVGCLDTHNVTLYGVPANVLRYNKRAREATCRRRERAYLGLCESLGGPVDLWARWCDHKATLNPRNWERAGYSVSLLHYECLTGDYSHNVRAFLESDSRATFEKD